MKKAALIVLCVFTAKAGLCDVTVMLPSDQRFIDNEKVIHVETSIPGDFQTLEGVLWALFTLSDQAKDSSLDNPFLPSSIKSTTGFEGAKPLAEYFRGATLKRKKASLRFSGDAMRYLNSTVSIQEYVKGSIEMTIKKNFRSVKEIEYIVDGEVITDWDA